MSEYIRKQDAINIAESYNIKREGFHLNDYEYGRDQVASSIASDLEDVEPADVAPVVHAYWIWHENADIICGYYVPSFECSKCRAWKEDDSDFCPDCGAKMDGEE